MTARNQHYVPQWYLRNWGDQKGRVVSSRHGHVLPPSNPRNLLAQRDFYAAPSLTLEDIAFLSTFILQHVKSANARPMAEVVLEGAMFQSLMRSLMLPSPHLPDAQREVLSSYLTDYEERRLGRSETRAQNVIGHLLNGDVAVLKKAESALDFFMFLGEMFFRTLKSREMMLQTVEAGPLSEGGAVVLTRILATNMACVQFFDRPAMPATILSNGTKQRFVTSDSPVVNILAPMERREPKEDEWAIYFPLSPTRALIVPPRNYRFAVQTATEELAAGLNAWMTESAHATVVAKSRDSLAAALDLSSQPLPSMREWFRKSDDPLLLRIGYQYINKFLKRS